MCLCASVCMLARACMCEFANIKACSYIYNLENFIKTFGFSLTSTTEGYCVICFARNKISFVNIRLKPLTETETRAALDDLAACCNLCSAPTWRSPLVTCSWRTPREVAYVNDARIACTAAENSACRSFLYILRFCVGRVT